jgi:iron complex outermembrane receptor protein
MHKFRGSKLLIIKNKFKRTALSVAILMAASNVAAEEIKEVDETEVIVVTGKIGSLTKSLSAKRISQTLIDSISSEDLGKFPDANVADSLAHIPGITISRVHGGEGQHVTIRGLGSDFNIVTLNNRLLATDDDGRNFAFDVLPSEMISGADVMKSVEASMLEGSIGGTVNLRSATPFNYDGFKAFTTVEGNYNDLSEDTGFKASGVISNTFNDDTMGLLVGFSHSDSTIRSDGLGELYYAQGWPETIHGEDSSDKISPCCYSVGSWIEDKQRTGVNATFQWQLNDEVLMTFDGLFTRLDSPAASYHDAYYVEAWDDAENWSDIKYDGNVITGVTVSELTPESVTRNEHRVVDTLQVGWKTEVEMSDNFSFTTDVYYSNSERKSGGKDSWVVAGSPGTNGGHTGIFSLNPNGLPNIEMILDDGRALGDLENDDYSPHWAGLQGTDVEDSILGLSFEGKLELDYEYLSSVEFGVNYTKRNKDRSTVDNDHTGGACTFCDYPFTFGDIGADVMVDLPVDNFLSGTNGNFQRDFLVFDIDAYMAALEGIDGQTINGVEYPVGTFESMLPVYNPVQSYKIEEENISAYIQADFNGDNWFANAGIRFVQTKTLANSAVNEFDTITQRPGGATAGFDVTYTDATPVHEKGNYTEILPSFNIGYNITDSLLFRAAASKTMARPSLNQLAPIAEHDASDGAFIINISGNPDLTPVKATQADLGLEWYFSESSALTGAIFWKDIENFITNQVEYNVPLAGQSFDITSPVNGDSADVLGFELGLQKFYDNGFGILANYTFTDTSAYVGGVDQGGLEGVPEQAYSLSLIYEKDGLSAQISADYTGEFTQALFTDIEGYEETSEASTWVTASVSYQLNEKTNVFLKANNLTDENKRSYIGRKDLPNSYEVWGRTVMFGVNYSF